MKIVFICGSLERGRDGVGDYTRRLAVELIKSGHQAAGVALNDRKILNELEEIEQVDHIEFPVLRLPLAYDRKKKLSLAKKWIHQFNPEWISLQYVPYSFQVKGLPFGLARFLKELGNGNNWHIMFHEMWIGADKDIKWKQKIFYFLQKRIVKQLVSALSPKVIHTHLPIYSQELQELGWEVKRLPLFSNIPVATRKYNSSENNIFRIGIFSQIESLRSIIAFLSDISTQVAYNGMRVEILILGGTEERIQGFMSTIEKLECLKNKVIYTGFLDEKELSVALMSCTIGLTSVPRHGLGKSGSVAAFLAHGIPVAAPNVQPGQDVLDIGFFSPNLKAAIVLEPYLELLENARKAALTAKNEIHQQVITRKFTSDLCF